MTKRELTNRRWLGITMLSTMLTAGCMMPAMQRMHASELVACADTEYVRLKQQPRDSLVERAGRRLQDLERACEKERADSRAQSRGTYAGMTGHGGNTWIGIGFATVMMAAMMVMMWW